MGRMGNVGKYSNILNRDAFEWGNTKISGELWGKVAGGALGEEDGVLCAWRQESMGNKWGTLEEVG